MRVRWVRPPPLLQNSHSSPAAVPQALTSPVVVLVQGD